MPQMSPMWWTSLYMMFMMTMFMTMIILYFMLTEKVKTTKVSKKTKNLNWTW
uniref:ATP synthase F0 subunit 8 n=1 Tax=Stethoconus japonicus TaxID=1929845 RepID=UPI0022F2FC5C|nr:ATP synthase F0 subunit 8 [Stethoconus japonicus]UFQ24458.1 ATP synthase F0 subunit 8 [Stethoconus japonicus]